MQTFVAQTLHFANFDDFLRMMQLKRKFESDWRAINALLEQAGARQRSDALYSLSVTQLDAFAANLQTALGLSTSRLISCGRWSARSKPTSACRPSTSCSRWMRSSPSQSPSGNRFTCYWKTRIASACGVSAWRRSVPCTRAAQASALWI